MEVLTNSIVVITSKYMCIKSSHYLSLTYTIWGQFYLNKTKGKTTYVHKGLYKNVYNNFAINGKNLVTSQMSLNNWRVNKLSYIYTKEILLSSAKKHISDTHNKSEWISKTVCCIKRKLDTKEYIHYNAIYIKIHRLKN